MIPKLRKSTETWVVIIAVLAAMILASHQLSQNSGFGLVANYIYWLFRVLIQSCLFIAVLMAVERYLGQLLPEWGSIALAIVLSLIPYALTVTAFDLILGLPELGFNGDVLSESSTATAFGFELIYLLDNHVVLCLMLLVPRFMFRHAYPDQAVESDEIEDAHPGVHPIDLPNAFINSFEPSLQGELCTVEAQEHYVQVVSTGESRMVLYRFSDVVRQMPSSLGMQVHRSHWVAHAAVKEIVMQGQTMKLALHDGRVVPVSRTFRNVVEGQFGKR